MKKIRHIVLITFKPGKAPRMAELTAALAGLRKVVPGFEAIEGGAYSSPEGLNQGYTHGFIMTFADAAARDSYLNHPEHEKVKQSFLPDLNAVIAFDFAVE
jgi:hypothetical protein